MSKQERIRGAVERNVKAMSRLPSIARGTAVTRVNLKEGLACEVEEGDWKLRVDLGEKSGGDNSGPNPGILGRGALGSCLVIGYALWAARRGIPIDSLEVEIEADYDARGMYGVDDVEPGYEEIRYRVTIESDAGEDEVIRMLDEADTHSDYLYAFARPQKLRRQVRIAARKG